MIELGGYNDIDLSEKNWTQDFALYYDKDGQCFKRMSNQRNWTSLKKCCYFRKRRSRERDRSPVIRIVDTLPKHDLAARATSIEPVWEVRVRYLLTVYRRNVSSKVVTSSIVARIKILLI
jgi:hypothetical protein